MVLFGLFILFIFIWLWVKFVNWLIPTKRKKIKNPYILLHLLKRQNEIYYVEYIEWVKRNNEEILIRNPNYDHFEH